MPDDPSESTSVQAETAQLRRRIAELEQQLQEATRKAADGQAQVQQMQQEVQQSQSALARLEAEMQQQQALVQLIIDHLPEEIGVYWKDRKGRYLGGNRKMYTDAGAAAPSEIIGKTDYDMPWANHADKYVDDDQTVMTDGVQKLYEEPVRSSDGSTLWVVSRKNPWVYNGQVLGIVGFAEDITRRKWEQQQLRIFQDIVENTPVPICKVLTRGEPALDYANPAYCKLFGYTVDETMGLPLIQMVAREPDYVLEVFNCCLEKGMWQGEVQHRRKDGTTFPAYLTAYVLYDAEGMPHSVVGFLQDLTERKQQEAQLRTFQILVENTPDAVIICDQHQVITYANTAAEAMYGFQSTLVGMTTNQLIASTEQLLLDQLTEQLIMNGKIRIQLRAQRASGEEFPVQVSGMVMSNDQRQPIGFAAIVRDLTEEHRAMAERQALQEQIIAAQQATVRELSTPLMPIADGVVVMPLIGSVDSQRAQAIMETTLQGITTYSAEIVILDITGVRVVDTQVAAALLRTARAAQLLGAEVVLTGISAEIAQTLVQIGADLGNIIAQNSLQQGIAYAMNRRKALTHALR